MLDFSGVGGAQFAEPATLAWKEPIEVLDRTALRLRLKVAKVTGADSNVSAGFVCYDDADNVVGIRLDVSVTVSDIDEWNTTETDFADWPEGTAQVRMIFQHPTEGSTIVVDEFSYSDITAINEAGLINATLLQDYRTSVDTDTAVTEMINQAKSEIVDPDGTSLGATVKNNYLTITGPQGSIASAIAALKTEIENPDGSSLGATVKNNYDAITQPGGAIALAVEGLESQIASGGKVVPVKSTFEDDVPGKWSGNPDVIAVSEEPDGRSHAMELTQRGTYYGDPIPGDLNGKTYRIRGTAWNDGSSVPMRVGFECVRPDGSQFWPHTEAVPSNQGWTKFDILVAVEEETESFRAFIQLTGTNGVDAMRCLVSFVQYDDISSEANVNALLESQYLTETNTREAISAESRTIRADYEPTILTLKGGQVIAGSFAWAIDPDQATGTDKLPNVAPSDPNYVDLQNDYFDFPARHNETFGYAAPLPYRAGNVYEVSAEIEALDDGSSGGCNWRIGFAGLSAGTSAVNDQSNTGLDDISVSDGRKRYTIWFTEDQDAVKPDYVDEIVIVQSGATHFLPYVRQNAGSSTDAILRVYSIETKDVSAYAETAKTNANIAENYYTVSESDQAAAQKDTQLKADIEDPEGDSLGATVEAQYQSIVGPDGAIASAKETLRTEIKGVNLIREARGDGAANWSNTVPNSDVPTFAPAGSESLRHEDSRVIPLYKENPAGRTFRFRGWVKSPNGFNLALRGGDSFGDGNIISEKQVGPFPSWTEIDEVVEVSPGEHNAYFSPGFNVGNSDDYVLSFDLRCEDVTDIAATNATVESNYRAITDPDTGSIAAATQALKTEIEDPEGQSLGATVDQNYKALTGPDGVIATAVETLSASIASGGKVIPVRSTFEDGSGDWGAATQTVSSEPEGRSHAMVLDSRETPYGDYRAGDLDGKTYRIRGTMHNGGGNQAPALAGFQIKHTDGSETIVSTEIASAGEGWKEFDETLSVDVSGVSFRPILVMDGIEGTDVIDGVVGYITYDDISDKTDISATLQADFLTEANTRLAIADESRLLRSEYEPTIITLKGGKVSTGSVAWTDAVDSGMMANPSDPVEITDNFFDLPNGANETFGYLSPVPYRDGFVYEVTLDFEVIQDGTLDDSTTVRVGLYGFDGDTEVFNEQSPGQEGAQTSASEGRQTKTVWFTSDPSWVSGDPVPNKPDYVDEINFMPSTNADSVFPYARQNAWDSDGQIRVYSLSIKDVSAYGETQKTVATLEEKYHTIAEADQVTAAKLLEMEARFKGTELVRVSYGDEVEDLSAYWTHTTAHNDIPANVGGGNQSLRHVDGAGVFPMYKGNPSGKTLRFRGWVKSTNGFKLGFRGGNSPTSMGNLGHESHGTPSGWEEIDVEVTCPNVDAGYWTPGFDLVSSDHYLLTYGLSVEDITDTKEVYATLEQNYVTTADLSGARSAIETKLGVQIEALSAEVPGFQFILTDQKDDDGNVINGSVTNLNSNNPDSAMTFSAGPAALGQAATLEVYESSHSRSVGSETSGFGIEIPEERALAFGGKRVKISVLARRTSSNSASRFCISYSTNDTGNSDIMESDRNLSNDWEWYDFFWDVTTPSSGGSDFIGLFGDSSQSGKGTRFARVVVQLATTAEDLPEIGNLSGEFESLKALDADYLSGTSFGAFRDAVEVSANQEDSVLASVYPGQGWGTWNNGPSYSNNEVFPYGKTMRFDRNNSNDSGIDVKSTDSLWIGDDDHPAYTVEIEIERLSGSDYSAAGILFDWHTSSGNYRADKRFEEMSAFGWLPSGRRTKISHTFKRPDTSGSFEYNRVYIMANYDGLGNKAPKDFKIHKIVIRPSTGIEASIVTQGTALADLEGNAESAYVMRATAGNAKSEIEMVAADDVKNGPRSALKFHADDLLLYGTVSAKHVNIGDFENYGGGSSKLGLEGVWQTEGTNHTVEDDSNSNYPYKIVLRDSGPTLYRQQKIAVNPGEQFDVRLSVWGSSTVNSLGSNAKLRFGDQNGDHITSVHFDDYSKNGWETFTGSFTVPGGVHELDVSIWNDLDGYVFISDIQIYRRKHGRLLVDGTISGDKLEADTITAREIDADAIRAHHIKSDEIRAEHIDADAIRSHHILSDEIKAGHLAADSVKARNIDVLSLSAISANLGSIEVDKAHIKDLAVDTIKIADGAVNATDYASSGSYYKNNEGWETRAEIDISHDGLPVKLWAYYKFVITNSDIPAGGSNNDSQVRIVNGAGDWIANSGWLYGNINDTHEGDLQAVEYNPSGSSSTYKLQVRTDHDQVWCHNFKIYGEAALK